MHDNLTTEKLAYLCMYSGLPRILPAMRHAPVRSSLMLCKCLLRLGNKEIIRHIYKNIKII